MSWTCYPCCCVICLFHLLFDDYEHEMSLGMLLFWNPHTVSRNPAHLFWLLWVICCINIMSALSCGVHVVVWLLFVNKHEDNACCCLIPCPAPEIHIDFMFYLFVLRCQLNVDTMLLLVLLVGWWWWAWFDDYMTMINTLLLLLNLATVQKFMWFSVCSVA